MDALEIKPRRVLVVAYYFPPMGLSGVQRTLKFVKYLPQFGWHPTVLTVEPRGYFAQDPSLLEEITSREVRVVRTHAAGPGRLYAKDEIVRLPEEWRRKLFSRISDSVFIPDNKIGWVRKAVHAAVRLHKETPFDVVFATGPPFTDFIVGQKIKSRINKPLVLDYRDPWVENPFKFIPTPLHRWLHRHLEDRALRASSHVVTTNRRVKEALIARHGYLTYHDIDIVPQGFDPEDYPPDTVPEFQAGTRAVRAPAHRSDKMKITYAGVFWEDRVPDYFLQALHDLFVEKPKLRGRIEAIFIGNFRDENMRLVERLGLQPSVQVLGYLPHRECVKHLREADVLWMISGDDYGTPGKAYEYIGARKPILACLPDGFMKNTILEAGGVTVAPDDTAGIRKAIEEFFNQFLRKNLKGPRPDIVEKYNRVVLTGSLVKIFESLGEP